jgi:HEAT repeat protein
MSLLEDAFSVLKDLTSAEGRLKLRINRATKTLLERYAQNEARMESVEKLRALGTPQAIYSLARRFSVITENLGVDQDEKRHVRDVLVGFGQEAVEPLQLYLRRHDQVTWAIDGLSTLRPDEEVAPFLFEILFQGDTVHIRGEKATQIMKALESMQVEGVVEEVIHCLKSSDDTVRIAAVECLEVHADERAREPLLEALVSDEEDSVRVQTRITETLERLGWEVKGFRKKVEAVLPEPYRVTSKGKVTR